MQGTTAKPSKIHGYGLFAVKHFKAGDVVQGWKDASRTLNQDELAALPTEERKYVSLIDGLYILFLPPARFVNHSCNPNAKGGAGWDIALRDISPGEEITVDYVAEQVPGLSLSCMCGASNCRLLLKV